MLYIIKVVESADKETVYHLFETHTESTLKITEKTIVELINQHGMKAKNFTLKEGKVQLKDWPHKITHCTEDNNTGILDYILLGKSSEQEYKLINPASTVTYLTEKRLKELIDIGDVANCDYIEEAAGRIYRSIDTYAIKANPKFKTYIDKKYDEFKAKTALIGLDISFRYTIENDDVKLTSYTGTSERVILPSFITTIHSSVFMYRHIHELKLNNGLKHIGAAAFAGNNLKHLELPETVEFLCQQACDFNHTRITVKKTNPDTVIIS